MNRIGRRASGILLLLLAAAIVPTACGGMAYSSPRQIETSSTVAASTVAALVSQHVQWQGVPYRAGGQSRKGVDCSGFVQLTFRERFGMDIPRSTSGLAGYGGKVHRSSLLPGDLVFFKTGFGKRHAGIYLEDGIFLHASTSRGVMLSSLGEDYWDQRFWQARRVMK
jgi:cell wall-associated NlpC family hydrolase